MGNNGGEQIKSVNFIAEFYIYTIWGNPLEKKILLNSENTKILSLPFV